jgi:DNA-binding response OmpR family regulator
MRIAVLEDDTDQAALLVHWLTEAGHQCTHYTESKPFIRSLSRDSFDLLILDWMIPEMNGLEVLKWVRKKKMSSTSWQRSKPAPMII